MPKKQRFSPTNLYKNRSFGHPPTPSRQEASVNDLLARHRHESTPPPSPAKRAAVERIVSSPTLPPSLRQLLDIPESEAPPPRRPTVRTMAPSPLRRAAANATNRSPRPPPGPAAPRSWLTGDLDGMPESSQAAGKPRSFDEQCAEAERRLRRAPGIRWQFTHSRSRKVLGRETGLDDVPMPMPRSLADFALKSMALNWEFIVEYEQLNLAGLPGHYKSWLLAYLGILGPENGLHVTQLKTLFLTNEELEGAAGGHDVKFLNLSTLMGENLTLSDVRRIFEEPKRSKGKSKQPQISGAANPDDAVPTSWDAEIETDDIPLPKSLDLRFPALTRLSLANPSAKSASWLEFLSVSKHLARLTHLSLAYWPVPSRTPNAATAVVIADHVPGEISLGGSHMYSALDQDWHEAANILRLLSKNLYCLRWLDLEGCHGWLSALIYVGSTSPTSLGGSDGGSNRPWLSLSDDPNDEAGPSTEFEAAINDTPGPDFNTYWQQIEYINLSQGWIPTDAGEIQSLPTSVISIELLEYLRNRWTFGLPKATTLPDASLSQVRKWINQEQLAREVALDIRGKRHNAGGKYLEVEYGWALDEFDGMEER